jgi:hypothetical protein
LTYGSSLHPHHDQNSRRKTRLMEKIYSVIRNAAYSTLRRIYSTVVHGMLYVTSDSAGEVHVFSGSDHKTG